MSVNEIIYDLVESAVSPQNTILVIIISLIVSFALGYLTKSLTKRSLLSGLFTTTTVQIIFIVLFLGVKDNIQAERLKDINDIFNNLNYDPNSSAKQKLKVLSWRDGYYLIRENPYELGYYLMTADILVDELEDYECASLLIEKGVDFLELDPLPMDVCRRLQEYYIHLPENRPRINNDCKKIIIID